MSDLRTFQSAFASALLAPAPGAAESTYAGQPAFAVHRNTVMAGCIDALAANHPTVQRLVGEEWFRDAARIFAQASPPQDGVLARYGLGFAEFLQSFVPAAELPYLAGVADLDRCWTESHLAADAPVLRPADVARLTPERLVRVRLEPHPAARWRSFETLPICTLWRRHREEQSLDDEIDWHGESILLARPGGSVAWLGIDAGAAAFLDACAQGRNVGESLDEVAAVAPQVDMAMWLPQLVQAGAFTRIVVEGSG